MMTLLIGFMGSLLSFAFSFWVGMVGHSLMDMCFKDKSFEEAFDENKKGFYTSLCEDKGFQIIVVLTLLGMMCKVINGG